MPASIIPPDEQWDGDLYAGASRINHIETLPVCGHCGAPTMGINKECVLCGRTNGED